MTERIYTSSEYVALGEDKLKKKVMLEVLHLALANSLVTANTNKVNNSSW